MRYCSRTSRIHQPCAPVLPTLHHTRALACCVPAWGVSQRPTPPDPLTPVQPGLRRRRRHHRPLLLLWLLLLRGRDPPPASARTAKAQTRGSAYLPRPGHAPPPPARVVVAHHSSMGRVCTYVCLCVCFGGGGRGSWAFGCRRKVAAHAQGKGAARMQRGAWRRRRRRCGGWGSWGMSGLAGCELQPA